MPRPNVLCLLLAMTWVASIASPANAGAPTRPVLLSLSGQVRDEVDGRQWRAWVSLTLPFDRFWAPRGHVAQSSGEEGEAEPAESEVAADSTPAVEPPEAPRASVRSVPGPQLGARFVRAVVAAALRAGGAGAAERRLRSLAARSRSSAALPTLWLRAGRSTDATLRLTPTLSEPDRYTESGGADLWMEARLTWNLDRLVFASDELAVERIRDQRASARTRLVGQVLEALFDWHRARLQARDPHLLPQERFDAALQQLETELTLDVLTAGWFSEHVEPADALQAP